MANLAAKKPFPASASFMVSKKRHTEQAPTPLDISHLNHYGSKDDEEERKARMLYEESDDDDDLDNIEEDISPGGDPHRVYGDYDLYQVPLNGGLPIKMIALDNNRRPFTPPFAQLIKVSHSGSLNNNHSSTTNT